MGNRNYNSNFDFMKVVIEIGALPTLQKKITYWFKLTGEHPQAREEIQLTHLKKNIIGDSKNKSEQVLLTPLWILEHYNHFIAKSFIKNLDERLTYCNSNNDKLDVLTEELNIIKDNVSDKRSIYYEGYIAEKRRINGYSFLTENNEFMNKKFGYSFPNNYMEGRSYYLVEKEIINRLESIKKTVSPTLVNKFKLPIEIANERALRQLEIIDEINEEPASKKRKSKKQPTPVIEPEFRDFNELFTDEMKAQPALIEQCYQPLIDLGITNDKLEFSLLPKGNICVWYQALKSKHLLKPITKNEDDIVTPLLNKKFPGVKLYIGAPTEYHKRANDNFQIKFKKTLPDAPK